MIQIRIRYGSCFQGLLSSSRGKTYAQIIYMVSEKIIVIGVTKIGFNSIVRVQRREN